MAVSFQIGPALQYEIEQFLYDEAASASFREGFLVPVVYAC
jgi:hypothetical protein